MEYTQDDISIAGGKGGSAFITGGKTGDFPLHPRKLNSHPSRGGQCMMLASGKPFHGRRRDLW